MCPSNLPNEPIDVTRTVVLKDGDTVEASFYDACRRLDVRAYMTGEACGGFMEFYITGQESYINDIARRYCR